MKHLSALHQSSLFDGIAQEDIQKLLACTMAQEKSYPKGCFIFRAGEPVRSVYLILSGSVHIIDEDFWGNQSIIETMPAQVFFGEAYVFAKTEHQLVSVVAAEDSVLLVMNPQRLFELCACECAHHKILIQNVANILATKIVRLTQKLRHLIRRTIREKLFSYLSQCAQAEGKSEFDIPYTRQQLADYLSVDRSALSHELSKMHKEGLLRYQKNHFELL